MQSSIDYFGTVNKFRVRYLNDVKQLAAGLRRKYMRFSLMDRLVFAVVHRTRIALSSAEGNTLLCCGEAELHCFRAKDVSVVYGY